MYSVGVSRRHLGLSWVVFFFLLVCSLFLTGCEEAEIASKSSSASSESSGLSRNVFSREVSVEFWDPVNKRIVSTPGVAEEDAEKLRALENARFSDGEDRLLLEQLVSRGGVLVDVNLLQDDPSGQQVAFAPRTLDDERFGPVLLAVFNRTGPLAESDFIEYIYQLPPADSGVDKGTLVRFGSSSFSSLEGETLVLRFEHVAGTNTARATINGEEVSNWEVPGDGASFYAPLLKSTAPGLYTAQIRHQFGGNITESGYSYL